MDALWRAVDGLDGGGDRYEAYDEAVGSGFMSSMNFTLPPVRKQWTWLFWKVSTLRKYLAASQFSNVLGSQTDAP